MAKTLEKASDHVLDVQEDQPDEDEVEDDGVPGGAADESRKDK